MSTVNTMNTVEPVTDYAALAVPLRAELLRRLSILEEIGCYLHAHDAYWQLKRHVERWMAAGGLAEPAGEIVGHLSALVEADRRINRWVKEYDAEPSPREFFDHVEVLRQDPANAAYLDDLSHVWGGWANWKCSTYTDEFKLQAVRMMTDQKLSVAEVTRRLDVCGDLLRAWKKAFEEQGSAAFPGHGYPSPADDELCRLRAENARLKAERDHLKNAATHFANLPS